MKYLLDTHILIWAFSDVERLSKKAFEVISDKENQIFYIILSIFEVEWKYIHRPQGMSTLFFGSITQSKKFLFKIS